MSWNMTAEAKRRTFWERVAPAGADECWLWQGSIGGEGYGVWWSGLPESRRFMAHRMAYEELRAEIPPGLHLDHLCRNRACVNPWHLEPVTSRVNVLRGAGVTARNLMKTHCKNGHEFTPENTGRAHSGGRRCRTCMREQKRRRAAKQ